MVEISHTKSDGRSQKMSTLVVFKYLLYYITDVASGKFNSIVVLRQAQVWNGRQRTSGQRSVKTVPKFSFARWLFQRIIVEEVSFHFRLKASNPMKKSPSLVSDCESTSSSPWIHYFKVSLYDIGLTFVLISKDCENKCFSKQIHLCSLLFLSPNIRLYNFSDTEIKLSAHNKREQIPFNFSSTQHKEWDRFELLRRKNRNFFVVFRWPRNCSGSI